MTYQETPYQKINIVDADGNIISNGGGSSGAGDASAANQESQITLETAILAGITNLAECLPAGQKTPGFINTTSSGTIASGKISIGILNNGNNTGKVLDADLPGNTAISFEAPGNSTLGAITYDATSTVFLITTVE